MGAAPLRVGRKAPPSIWRRERRGWPRLENDDKGEPGPLPGGNGDYQVVGGGGTGTIYVEDDEDVPGIAQIVSALDGVDFIASRDPIPGVATVDYEQVGLDHANSGDITVFAQAHWHDGDSKRRRRAGLRARGELFSRPEGGPGNLSIAPTVAALFGIGQPQGGYTRPPLGEPFEPGALVPRPGCRAAHAGYPRPRQASPVDVPLVPAHAECTDPNRYHGAPLAYPSCAPPAPRVQRPHAGHAGRERQARRLLRVRPARRDRGRSRDSRGRGRRAHERLAERCAPGDRPVGLRREAAGACERARHRPPQR